MAATASEFLEHWRSTYIYAEARDSEELDATIGECVQDAEEEGFSRADLEKAAGGDLNDYIRRAIEKTGGE
jgi:hypothetical protein